MKFLETLEQTKLKTLGYFDLNEQDLQKRYAPDKWSVKEILHHLSDAESVLYERIRRTISEPKPIIFGFHQDLWAERLEYPNLPLNLNRKVFESSRDMVIHLAQKYYETLGHLEFVHSHTGLRTLKDEFDKVAWHNENHLVQIEKALSIP